MSIFSSDRLHFRKFILEDLPDLCSITSDPSIMRTVGNGKVWDEEKTKGFIEWNIRDPDDLFYAVIDTKTNALVGCVGIRHNTSVVFPTYRKNYLLTVFMAKEHQGKGYGSEAVFAIVCHFNAYNVYATVLNNNTASITMFSKVPKREISRNTKIRTYRLFCKA